MPGPASGLLTANRAGATVPPVGDFHAPASFADDDVLECILWCMYFAPTTCLIDISMIDPM